MVKSKKKLLKRNPESKMDARIRINPVYTVEEESSISKDAAKFQKKYPFTRPVIDEAPDKIRKFFPNTKIEYVVAEDPDEADSEMLVILVYTPFNRNEAYEKLQLLDDYWFLDACEKSDCRISINLILL